MINNSISVRLYFSVSISGAESPKAPAPLGMESGAILTHRLPLPPCLIINMPHRMLDYISKGPKNRLGWLGSWSEKHQPKAASGSSANHKGNRHSDAGET